MLLYAVDICDVLLCICINTIWATSWQNLTKWHVRPAKTRNSLGICPVWSEISLCTQWVAKDPRFLHGDSEDSDQTGRMPRLIWVFAGHTCHFVGFVMRRWFNYDDSKTIWADHIVCQIMDRQNLFRPNSLILYNNDIIFGFMSENDNTSIKLQRSPNITKELLSSI